MTQTFGGSVTNQKTTLQHPVGLFVLFFTEMWERFSYYGMRAILVLFLTSKVMKGGFGWDSADALVLYGWYTGLVYLTPLIGGWIADNFIGSRNGVVIGALVMTLGHASLAMESHFFFYLGILLLIVGNGFFKPNIVPIVGQMYPDGSPLKDGAYTVFYMAVNAGAFFGMLICGWLGETKGWSYGFGAAGIFMFFGLLQFYFGQKIFGDIGTKPSAEKKDMTPAEKFGEKQVDWTNNDSGFFIGSLALAVLTVIASMNFDRICLAVGLDPSMVWLRAVMMLPFIILMTYFVIQRLRKYPPVERDRLGVIAIFAFFVIFFWLSFEQAGGSLTIFARDFTQRVLATPASVNAFRYVSLALTFLPMVILTWAITQLGIKIGRKYPLTILFTALSFALIWLIVIKINVENFENTSAEVPASWFGSLNGFFIITLGPLFSAFWVWMSKINKNPSGPIKFGAGLLLLGLGFVGLVIASSGIPKGATAASVSMLWIVLFYLLQTMGELCLSPVGLAFVNKLSPKRLMALMFGVWHLANFVANTLSGIVGSYMDQVSQNSSMSGFFTIFVGITFSAGILLILLNKPLKRMMHGIN